MSRRSHGSRSGTRKKMSARHWTVNEFMKSFKNGDSVVVNINPAIHDGHPHPKFQGRTGVVTGKQGDSYLLKLLDGNKEKTLISTPIHLKAL